MDLNTIDFDRADLGFVTRAGITEKVIRNIQAIQAYQAFAVRRGHGVDFTVAASGNGAIYVAKGTDGANILVLDVDVDPQTGSIVYEVTEWEHRGKWEIDFLRWVHEALAFHESRQWTSAAIAWHSERLRSLNDAGPFAEEQAVQADIDTGLARQAEIAEGV